MGGCCLGNSFAERIEKPIQKILPPLIWVASQQKIPKVLSRCHGKKIMNYGPNKKTLCFREENHLLKFSVSGELETGEEEETKGDATQRYGVH